MGRLSRRSFLKVAVASGGLVAGGAVWQLYRLIRPASVAQGPTPQVFVPLAAKTQPSPSAIATATSAPAGTATNTPAHTPTSSANTPAATNTLTSTPTATNTPTDTPTITNTPTDSPTITNTPTDTPTATNTPTETPTSTATPTGTVTAPEARVLHTMNASATNWDFSTGWYGDYVSQAAVDQMTDEGLMRLTGTSTRLEAWQALLPSYASGERVAIKVNFNNCLSDGCPGNAIDALIEPVNSLIGGLVEREVATSDIYVFDVTHAWHDGRMDPKFVAGCDYGGVQFVAYVGNPNPFSATEYIHFNTPPGGPPLSDLPVCNVLVEADYVINVPIVKVHPFTGVTLGFKNHFGSFDRCDYPHIYTPGCPSDVHPNCYYDPSYSPLIDIYGNEHIGGKTILTVGDCLFGAWNDPTWLPMPWTTFGNGASNSLFFATDPVAIECVMTDILAAETAVMPSPDDWLMLAEQAGFGVYERGDPWANTYQQIEYIRVVL